MQVPGLYKTVVRENVAVAICRTAALAQLSSAAAKGANGKLGEITERNLGIVVTAEAIG